MKGHFFRRTFLLYFVVLLVSVVFIEYYITRVVRSNYINNLKERLTTHASLLSEAIPLQQSGSLDEYCAQTKLKTGARITIINSAGRVRGDSDIPSRQMDNHANRPEVRASAVAGTGSSIRFSETLQEDLLYVAKKVVRGSFPKGFIRLAVPLREVDKSVNLLRFEINLVVIFLFLFTGSLLVWQTNRIRKMVHKISEHTGALAHGLFKHRLHLEGANEFTLLAENLNDMAYELQESLREKDEEANRLDVILKSIPDALLLINTDGTIALSNNVARELFGSPHLNGKPYIEVVRSTDFISLVDNVKKNKMSGSGDIIIDTPEEKHLSVRISPLSYKVGELSGMAAIFHDTTHLKNLEKMRQDFVANVSHEVKTPVTAIKGFAETLLDGALHDTKNAEKFLDTIKVHSERLDRLVDDLLTISRIELGAARVNKTECNIADIADRVIETMSIQSAEKALEIKNMMRDENIAILADRDRLEQILINLLDNAIKFTEQGKIEIGVSGEKERRCIYVRDTGIGIPEKYVPRLGERFFRVDPSRSRELGGTGLGLAIVKHLVKAHGWDMKVESRVGEGTTVRIYF